MNRGSENFQKCGFSLISEKCVRTGVPKCRQICINADEWAAYIKQSNQILKNLPNIFSFIFALLTQQVTANSQIHHHDKADLFKLQEKPQDNHQTDGCDGVMLTYSYFFASFFYNILAVQKNQKRYKVYSWNVAQFSSVRWAPKT